MQSKVMLPIYVLFIVLLSINLVSCAPDESKYGKDIKDPTKSYLNVYNDDFNHSDGFHLAVHSNPDTYGEHLDEDIYLDYDKKGDTNNIKWELAQWHSPESLGLHHSTYSYDEINNIHSYKNDAREIRCNPTTNEIYLQLDSSKEYIALNGEPRIKKEDANSNKWSHFLMQRTFDTYVPLARVSSLILEFDFTIHYCNYKGLNNIDRSGVDGASQIFMYFTVHSDDHTKVTWFGIPLYDSRYNVIPKYINKDIWSSLPIYSLSSDSYFPVNKWYGMKYNRKYHVCLDILPYMIDAFVNEKVMPTATLDELNAIYINYGFEMPGAFDMAATLGNLNILYSH